MKKLLRVIPKIKLQFDAWNEVRLAESKGYRKQGDKERILFIFSRYHKDPKNRYYNSGTGVAQREILSVLENMGYDVYFGGQEDYAYPENYIKDAKAVIYIAPALDKFLKFHPKAKLVLFANNSHVLERNRRMTESAKKWGLKPESLGPEQYFLPAYEKSDYIMVAANEKCVKTFLDNGIPREKIAFWHNIIDSEVYKPSEKKFDQFTFMYWSSEVGLRKGLPALIAAWKKWNNPNARLVIMGILTKAGKELLYKKTLFGSKPNYPENVMLYGSKGGFVSRDPEVRKMLAQSHVGVFPTLEDNQPACVMEMAASGLPMILTEESGFELDPSWSWKVEADNVDSLVAALDAAYKDKNLAQKAKSARQFMSDHHSAQDFRKIFEDFVKNNLA